MSSTKTIKTRHENPMSGSDIALSEEDTVSRSRIAGELEQAFRAGDPEAAVRAAKKVLREYGGKIPGAACDADRSGLEHAPGDESDPAFMSVIEALNALGLKIVVEEKDDRIDREKELEMPSRS